MNKLMSRINRISIRTLLSYFSILLVPLCAVLVIYFMTMDAILMSRQETALNNLKETASIMSARLEELNNISSYIYSDSNANAIINRSRVAPKQRNIFAFYQTIEALPNYTLSNQMIEDVFLFFNEAEFVVKQPNAFAYTAHNYGQHIRFHGISYEEIRTLSKTRYAGDLLVSEDETGRDVLLLRSIPNTQTPSGLIVLRLNTHTIDSIMNTNETGPGGGVYVLTRDGKVVSHIGNGPFDTDFLADVTRQNAPAYHEIEYNGMPYLLCLVPDGNLIYLTLSEKGYLLSGIAPFRTLIGLMSGLALLLGSAICLQLWRRRHKVVKRIESTARSAGIELAPVRNEAHLLEATVGTLADKVDTLRKMMDQQRAVLMQTVAQRCMMGTFPSRADLLHETSALEMNLDARGYCVVRVLLLDPWEIQPDNAQILPYRIFLKQFFKDYLPIPHVIADIDSVSFAILVTLNEPCAVEALVPLFRDLSEQIGRRDWVAPSFLISTGCADIWEVNAQYQQTDEIATYMALLEKRGVLSAGDLPPAADAMHFPMELEIRFIKATKGGSAEALDALFNQIMEANLAQRTLNVTMLRSLFESIRRAILASIPQEGADAAALAQALSSVKSLNGLRRFAKRMQEQLLRATQVQDNEEHRLFKALLHSTVDANLSNPDFNLAMISQMTNLPEPTLYRMFKDYFGISFSGYLEQQRINRAFELLKNQTLVKDVAKEVGYLSDHTFRRAFKRIMKVSPSQFTDLT